METADEGMAAQTPVARDGIAAADCVQILDGFRGGVVGVADDLLDVTLPAVLSLALSRAADGTGHDAFSRFDSAWGEIVRTLISRRSDLEQGV